MYSSEALPRRSLREDLRALWLVRSKVLYTDLAFWLVVIGYNPRSRSFTSSVYLVYALVFFALWIFMVLILLADFAARLLLALPLGAASLSAAVLGSLALLAWFLVELYQAARRSPFNFTEQDAQILCMTPLDRRLVALAWFLEAWLLRGFVVWAAAIVLGYALLQAQSPRPLTTADLPAYLLAGLRMFTPAVPLSLAALGLAWAAGARRLHGLLENAPLRWLAPALIVLAAGGYLLLGAQRLLVILAPLSFPVQAGLGLAPWLAGVGAALLLALLGLAALWLNAGGMSLARAAQESQGKQAIRAAGLTGRQDLAEDIRQKERLGAGRPPTRLPARPGAAALLWKRVVQAQRRFQLSESFAWLGILGLNLAMIAYPNWGTRGWAAAIWVLLVLQHTNAPLRRELSRWWLLHLLPFPSQTLIAAALVLPVIGVWLAGLAALAIAALLGWAIPAGILLLYLLLAPAVSLAGSIDILRQSRTGRLLVGSVPDITLVGLLLGLVVAVLIGGAAWLLGVAGLPLAILVGAGVTWLLYGISGGMLRGLQ